MKYRDLENDGVEIFVVEDSPTQAEELRYTLERHGFSVSVAGNGVEALSMIRRRRPTIVISDIVMPEMDGYQLCREIKNDGVLKDIPVILLTALSDPRDVIRGLECGADNFITKPYDEKYILSRIQYILANMHLSDLERTQLGVEVILTGEKYFIKSDRIQILNLLLSSYEAAIQKNGELIKARDALTEFNAQLEKKVKERTVELSKEISERKLAEEQRKKVEEQLHHAQKMEALGTLVGGIAHDFNNILQAIIGFGSLMQMQMEETHPWASNLDQILTLADRASTLTRSLLTFGRKQEIQTLPVNLNEIVRNLEKMLSRLLRDDIELNVNLCDEDLIVLADNGQIQQVLMNLATNARDAMHEGGIITISTVPFDLDEDFIIAHGYGEQGRYALLMFSDNGEGMDEKTRQRVFEPFFTTKEVGKGTGLGLSVCYGIIKQHNGYINCYSEPGKGTTFRIYLPRIEAVDELVKPLPLAPPPRGNETILVAEDDKLVRIMTKAILETFGYQVIEAADGEEAVAQYLEHRDKIGMILVDVIMPKKNGKEVYDEISAIRPGIKAIFSSGYPAGVFHRKDILENGFTFVAKPVTPAELLRKIREVLDRS